MWFALGQVEGTLAWCAELNLDSVALVVFLPIFFMHLKTISRHSVNSGMLLPVVWFAFTKVS